MENEKSLVGRQYRATVRQNLTIKGKGLHSGEPATLQISPAEPGTGLIFRAAGNGKRNIPVNPFHVIDTSNAVTLGNRDWQIRTVEHLLAAFCAAGISDAYLEIDSTELPIMDGSALPFFLAITENGICEFDVEMEPLKITSPVWVVDKDRFLVALPSDKFQVNLSLFYDHPLLKAQNMAVDINRDVFIQSFIPARTFGFLRDVTQLKSKGLIKGASLENAIVLNDEGYENSSLRFEDECLRHKIVDLVGDLYLMGRPLQALIIASKSGHTMDVNLAKKILTSAAMDELALRKGRKVDLAGFPYKYGV